MRIAQIIIGVLGAAVVGLVVLTVVSPSNQPTSPVSNGNGNKRSEAAATIIDVNELPRQSQAHVTKVVGSEPSCEPADVPGHGAGLRCKWNGPRIEALFYNDKLARAEITGAGVKFAPESGELYGITSQPRLKNDNVITWNVDGFEASIFHDGLQSVSYFYLSDGE